MWALVPIKRLTHAKQRLAPVLLPAERAQLLLAMARDVLTRLMTHPALENTLVVSDDPAVAALASELGAHCMGEALTGARGLNAAVATGVQALAARGVQDVLIVHADLPLISAAELTRLTAAHTRALQRLSPQAPGLLTIAPDDRQQGSNCMICSPANGMQFHYGEFSYARHCAEAIARCMHWQTVSLPGMACDVDTPEDLRHLCKQVSPVLTPATYACVLALGLAQRLIETELLDCAS